jgi:hypothetical protein
VDQCTVGGQGRPVDAPGANGSGKRLIGNRRCATVSRRVLARQALNRSAASALPPRRPEEASCNCPLRHEC